MKIKNYITGLAGLLAFGFCSCESPDLQKGMTYDKGLMDVIVNMPGDNTDYRATVKGPYNDQDTVYVKMPTTEEDPLDVTNLRMVASVENDCKVLTSLTGEIDFTKPYTIQVEDAFGTVRTNYVKIVPILPKTLFNKEWSMSHAEMNVECNNTNAAVVGNYVIVSNYTEELGNPSGFSSFKVYDRKTREYVKTILSPMSLAKEVKADDAGHFVICRYNMYGAGVVVDYFEDINSEPRTIISYTADEYPTNYPEFYLGTRMSVCGNLASGKAYVYATAIISGWDQPNIKSAAYCWELNDGVVKSNVPTLVNCPTKDGKWSLATVQRASTAPDAEHYFGYCDFNFGDATQGGSTFGILGSDGILTKMDPRNHDYTILRFKVFQVHGDTFVALLSMGHDPWDGIYLRVFEITDPKMLSKTPGSDNYSDFCRYTSPCLFDGWFCNYSKIGDVDVAVEGDEAYIYTEVVGHDAALGGLHCYKMRYFPQ